MNVGGFYIGLKTYEGHTSLYHLASWHNPRSHTWRWVVAFDARLKKAFGLAWWRGAGSGHFHFRTPWGSLSFQWQANVWRR